MDVIPTFLRTEPHNIICHILITSAILVRLSWLVSYRFLPPLLTNQEALPEARRTVYIMNGAAVPMSMYYLHQRCYALDPAVRYNYIIPSVSVTLIQT